MLDAANYITNCIAKGITASKDIAEQARMRLAEIERMMHEAEKLRSEKVMLEQLIKSMGAQETKTKPVITLTEDTTQDQLDEQSRFIIKKIVDLVKVRPSKPRELMVACGVGEKDYEVYAALKWLVRRGICLRHNDGTYSQGEMWEACQTL